MWKSPATQARANNGTVQRLLTLMFSLLAFRLRCGFSEANTLQRGPVGETGWNSESGRVKDSTR